MTPDEHRRRIDAILDRDFLAAIDTVAVDELREKLRDARSEEDALSYIRRNLHGRLDLLRAELESREGGRRGAGHDIGTLTAALADRSVGGRGVRAGLGLRAAAVAGRRRAEQVLTEDHLAQLPDLGIDDIKAIVDQVTAVEQSLSAQRHRLHEVIDVLESELATRYKAGLEPSLERLQ